MHRAIGVENLHKGAASVLARAAPFHESLPTRPMKRLYSVLFLLSLASASQTQKSATPVSPGYSPPRAYDSARNAARDIEEATAEARTTGKRILIDIGGDWCPWCRALDEVFRQYPDLLRLRERNFITVPVYYSSENRNQQVLSHYSKVLGIPHVFVLDSTGKELHSQHMIDLQINGVYNPDKVKAFLTTWSPSVANAADDQH